MVSRVNALAETPATPSAEDTWIHKSMRLKKCAVPDRVKIAVHSRPATMSYVHQDTVMKPAYAHNVANETLEKALAGAANVPDKGEDIILGAIFE